MPSAVLPSMYPPLETNPTTPLSPMRSVAHRNARIYESYRLFFSCAVDRFAYVCSIRPSNVGYFTLAFRSFALLCPTEYGGFPMITLIGVASCRKIRALLYGNMIASIESPASEI